MGYTRPPARWTRRDALKAAGASVTITGLAGCLDDHGDGEGPYVIGMVDHRTGTLSPYGERNERGSNWRPATVPPAHD